MEHEPAPIEWEDDRSDAPMQDPTAPDAVRFAGCSIDSELRLLEASTK